LTAGLAGVTGNTVAAAPTDPGAGRQARAVATVVLAVGAAGGGAAVGLRIHAVGSTSACATGTTCASVAEQAGVATSATSLSRGAITASATVAKQQATVAAGLPWQAIATVPEQQPCVLTGAAVTDEDVDEGADQVGATSLRTNGHGVHGGEGGCRGASDSALMCVV
jgi:hypothetical protein